MIAFDFAISKDVPRARPRDVPNEAAILFDFENDRHTWLRARRRMLTASDVAAVLGRHPTKTPFAVWEEKTRHMREPDPPASQAAEELPEWVKWGQILEAPVAREVAERESLTLTDLGRHALLFTSIRVDIGPDAHGNPVPVDVPIGCTLDRIARPARTRASDNTLKTALACGSLEIKTVGAWADPLGEWENEGPVHAIVQLQTQMLVCGFTWGILAGLSGGQELRIHHHNYNESFMLGHALPRLAHFWHSVETQVPPPVDGAASTREALGRLFSKGGAPAIELDAKATEAFNEYAANQERIRFLEKENARAAAVIQLAMGDAERATPAATSGIEGLVRWSKIEPTKATDCPACHAQVKPPAKAYRRFTIGVKI